MSYGIVLIATIRAKPIAFLKARVIVPLFAILGDEFSYGFLRLWEHFIFANAPGFLEATGTH